MSPNLETDVQKRRENYVSFFASLCLFFSAIEFLIPKPLPFLRLGLANLPIIIALNLFSAKEYFALVLLKVLLQGLISGTFFSYIFIFSVCGTFASSIVMLAAHKIFKHRISEIGISLAGSLANNFVQIILARLFLFKTGAKYIAPLLLSCGTVTGVLLGIVATLVVNKSEWYKLCALQTKLNIANNLNAQNENSQNRFNRNTAIFFVTLFVMIIFLFLKNWVAVTSLCAIFYATLFLKRKLENKSAPKIFAPLAIIFSVAIFSLLSPNGKVIARFFNLPITYGALTNGLKRGCLVTGTVFLSRIAITPDLRVPCRFGKNAAEILSCFERLTAAKNSLHVKTLFSDVDRLLCSFFLIEIKV